MLSFIESDKTHESMCERANGTVTPVEVPFRSLNNMLLEFGETKKRIDLLSIDIEGLELTALKGLDFARWSPRMIIAEANDAELITFLDQQGYQRASSVGANWLFMKTSDSDNVFHRPQFEFIHF